MNIPTLKGYIQEAIKFELMKLETEKDRVNAKTTTYIIDYEELFRTQGKIQAFREILTILNIETNKELLNANYGLSTIEKKYAKRDIETITQVYADTDSIKVVKKEGDS